MWVELVLSLPSGFVMCVKCLLLSISCLLFVTSHLFPDWLIRGKCCGCSVSAWWDYLWLCLLPLLSVLDLPLVTAGDENTTEFISRWYESTHQQVVQTISVQRVRSVRRFGCRRFFKNHKPQNQKMRSSMFPLTHKDMQTSDQPARPPPDTDRRTNGVSDQT